MCPHSTRQRYTIVIVTTLILLAVLASTAAATDNILVNFPYDPNPVCPPNFKYAFVDVDGDPGTGLMWEEEWYPTEVEIAIIPINYGDMWITTSENEVFQSVYGDNCQYVGFNYCSTGGGKHLIRFIDVTAPGWEVDNTSTWVEATPKQVYGRTSLPPQTCGVGIHRYYGYSEFEGLGKTLIWQVPNEHNLLDFYFVEPEDGISELVGVTYFIESGLADLRLSNSPLLTYINLEQGQDFNYDDHYDVSFGYDILDPDGMRFRVVPYWQGSVCPGVSYSTSTLYSSGTGAGSAWFTLNARSDTEVDEIRLEVWNADNTDLVYEESRDVYLYFHSSDASVTGIDLSDGYEAALKYLDSIYVCFCYKVPPGMQAIVVMGASYQGTVVPGYLDNGLSLYSQSSGCKCKWFTVEDLKGSRGVIPMDEIELRLYTHVGDLVAERNIPVKYSFSEYICGDFNGSENTDIDDVVYLIDYLFLGGPDPIPFDSGDIDCSGGADIDDVVYSINYLFQGGPLPCDSDGDGFADCM